VTSIPVRTSASDPELSRGSGGDQDRHESQSSDPRDVSLATWICPGEPRRQPVRDRDRSVELRESEVRILATTGAFRVVPAKDLWTSGDVPRVRDRETFAGFREEGLVEARPYVVGREKTSLVTLTERGRELLQHHRIERGDAVRQEFYAGVVKPRELAHDSQLYRAYVHAAERLRRGGSTGQASRPRLRAEARLSALPARSQSRAPARRA
jgi:hypothetical protein